MLTNLLWIGTIQRRVDQKIMKVVRLGIQQYYLVELSTLDAGKEHNDTARVSKFKRMELLIQASGKTTKLTGTAFLFMQTVEGMRVTGRMTRHMDTENSLIAMALLMTVNGSMTTNMGKVLNTGLMAQVTKVFMIKETNMDTDATSGVMDLDMRETG